MVRLLLRMAIIACARYMGSMKTRSFPARLFESMDSLIVVSAVIYILNTLPAFAPPTWMVLSFVEFNHPQFNPLTLALAAAFAATLGRITLATLSQFIIRNKLLNTRTKANIDVLKEVLEHRKSQTAGTLLVYSFTPLPSNYLFIAYGLTTLPIKLIAVPFFIGRMVSYAAWIFLGQEAYKSLDINAGLIGGYLGAYFILTQIGFLLLIYPFTKVDWRSVLIEKKFRWLK
jgi:membrane protein YqaA with SNARE-associated domain